MQEGRVLGGLDEVALRIDAVEVRRIAGDLPAHQHGAGQVGVAGQCHAVAGDDLAYGFGHQRRGVVEGRNGVQIRARAVQALLEQVHYRLRGRQVARALQHDQPFAGDAEGVELAEGGDMVDARIGPRVGNEHQAFGQMHGDAVSHADSPCWDSPRLVFGSRRREKPGCSPYCSWTNGAGCASTLACICSPPPPRRMPRTGQASR
ncbi:hypothetical protein D3C85_1105250 [compost metagenome]